LQNLVAIVQTVVDITQFWIFQDGGFLKFYTFNDPNGQEKRTASLCQILSKSLKPRRRYVSFRIFKMAPPPPWIFEISNFNGHNGQEG